MLNEQDLMKGRIMGNNKILTIISMIELQCNNYKFGLLHSADNSGSLLLLLLLHSLALLLYTHTKIYTHLSLCTLINSLV